MSVLHNGEEVEGEQCQRCLEVDHDRRTLWMVGLACFYDMRELQLPLVEQLLLLPSKDTNFEEHTKPGSIALPGGKTLVLNPGQVTTSDPLTPTRVFTLRVCKRCRADWMQAQQAWFANKPADDGY